jgi:hypothetical protein
MLIGEPTALLVTVTLPLKVAPVLGANVTLNMTLVPAAMLRGVVTPLTLNPVPFAITCETVTVPVPVLVRVPCSVLLLPTLTLPKLRLRGLVLSRYDKPTPESAMVVGELVALLTTVTVPVAFPPTVGVKLMLKEAPLPASKVKGNGIELELKPAPFTVTCEMVTVPVPLF